MLLVMNMAACQEQKHGQYIPAEAEMTQREEGPREKEGIMDMLLLQQIAIGVLAKRVNWYK